MKLGGVHWAFQLAGGNQKYTGKANLHIIYNARGSIRVMLTVDTDKTEEKVKTISLHL